jgi:hypothetical protein
MGSLQELNRRRSRTAGRPQPSRVSKLVLWRRPRANWQASWLLLLPGESRGVPTLSRSWFSIVNKSLMPAEVAERAKLQRLRFAARTGIRGVLCELDLQRLMSPTHPRAAGRDGPNTLTCSAIYEEIEVCSATVRRMSATQQRRLSCARGCVAIGAAEITELSTELYAVHSGVSGTNLAIGSA